MYVTWSHRCEEDNYVVNSSTQRACSRFWHHVITICYRLSPPHVSSRRLLLLFNETDETLLVWHISCCALVLLHRVSKTSQFVVCLCEISIEWQNSFTGTLHGKFAIKLSLKIPPHIKRVRRATVLHYLVKYECCKQACFVCAKPLSCWDMNCQEHYIVAGNSSGKRIKLVFIDVGSRIDECHITIDHFQCVVCHH